MKVMPGCLLSSRWIEYSDYGSTSSERWVDLSSQLWLDGKPEDGSFGCE